MNSFWEAVATVAVVILFAAALLTCWVCAVTVSWEIFLPIAMLLTALAGIIIVGGLFFK